MPETRKFWNFVWDEIAYAAVRQIVSRSHRSGVFKSPLVVPINDLIGQRLISTGKYEMTQFDAIEELLSSPESFVGSSIDFSGMFLDVGANIGLFSLKLAPYFAKTIAIEAHPATFLALKANIALSLQENIEAICAAASDGKTDSLTLNAAKDGMLGWSTVEDYSGFETYEIAADVVTIDRLKKVSRVALIKIDVEGHELEVLQGALETLREDRPVVFFEVLTGERGAQSVGLLQASGYDQFFTFKRDRNFRSMFFGAPVRAHKLEPLNVGRDAMVCALPGIL